MAGHHECLQLLFQQTACCYLIKEIPVISCQKSSAAVSSNWRSAYTRVVTLQILHSAACLSVTYNELP